MRVERNIRLDETRAVGAFLGQIRVELESPSLAVLLIGYYVEAVNQVLSGRG